MNQSNWASSASNTTSMQAGNWTPSAPNSSMPIENNTSQSNGISSASNATNDHIHSDC